MKLRLIFAALALSLGGCQLLVDFDRSKVPPQDAGEDADEDAGEDAGEDADEDADEDALQTEAEEEIEGASINAVRYELERSENEGAKNHPGGFDE